MKERIKWIDGLKGLACMVVMWHHLSLGFLPAAYYGAEDISHVSGGLDVAFAQSPFGFVLNGNFMVALFCLVSGLLLAWQVMELKNLDGSWDIVIKRYPRLMLPIIPVVFAVYGMLKLGWFFGASAGQITKSPWLQGFYLEEVPLWRCLDAIISTTWFSVDPQFSNAFWMLNMLFVGSFVAIILAIMERKANKGILWVYALAAVIFARMDSLIFTFVLGVIFAYCLRYVKKMFQNKYIGAFCILLGLWLGGYPSLVEPNNLYGILPRMPEFITDSQLWHMIGAGFLVFGVCSVGIVQHILECQIFVFLGKISYSIYIVHIPIIYSLSSLCMIKLHESGLGYLKSVAVVFVLTNLVVILISYLYNRYYESFCGKVVNWLVQGLKKKEENV